MMDEVFATMRARADAWEAEATRRRAISPTDPVADTLAYCAGDLRAAVNECAATKTWLEVPEFAALQDPPVTPQAVRQWIKKGELAAVWGMDGHWKIRRDARRVPKPRRALLLPRPAAAGNATHQTDREAITA